MRRLRRTIVPAAVVLAVLQFLLAAAVLWQRGAPGALGGDFIAYFGAARQVLATGWQQVYTLPAQLPFQQALLAASGLPATRPHQLPFDYPPPALLIFLPFGMFPARLALLLWLACNLIATYFAWRCLVRIRGASAGAPPHAVRGTVSAGAPRADASKVPSGFLSPDAAPGRAAARRAAPLAVFLLLPFDWGLLSGQPVGLLLLLAALSFQALLVHQDRRGGVWLALLAVLKPQLVAIPLLGLVVFQRRRAVLAAALTGLSLVAVSIALVGLQGLLDYLQLLGRIDPTLGNAALAVRTETMINWRAWITALPGVDSATATALTAVAALLTVGVALLAVRRRPGDRAFPTTYLGIAAAGLVAGYHSHYQDLVVLLPPAVAALPAIRADLPGAMPNYRGTAGSGGPDRSARFTASLPLRLATPVAAGLLVAAPALAWLVVGLFAIAWLPIWTAMAGIGLLLLVAALWGPQAQYREPDRTIPNDQASLPATEETGPTAPRSLLPAE